jgi:hypothetical protein
MKLKRRFLKDRKGTDVYFAKREIARQKIRTVCASGDLPTSFGIHQRISPVALCLSN